MGNITIFEEGSSLPVVKRESKLADKMGGDFTTRRIATNTNGTFRRVVNGENIGKAVHGHVDVIIVDLLKDVSRTFYAGAYDPTAKPTLPDCWSNLGVAPEPNVPNQQSDLCATCPQNTDGSGQNGRGKACRYQRRVAVLIAGDPSGDTYQMSFAAKSLFGKGVSNTHPFESYKNFLRANGEALDTVVTRVMYDLEADTMTLKFKAVRHLTQDEVDLVDAAQADPATSKLVELTVAAADKVKAKPAPAPAAVVEPANDEAPVGNAGMFDDGEDEEQATYVAPAPTPAKRASKPKAAAPEKKEMADILQAWGGEDDEGVGG